MFHQISHHVEDDLATRITSWMWFLLDSFKESIRRERNSTECSNVEILHRYSSIYQDLETTSSIRGTQGFVSSQIRLVVLVQPRRCYGLPLLYYLQRW